ncbi:MAG: hypothetical protein A2Z75_00290 [Chloroflexi bacterium RBG_13_50_10]|nr:MAG: hypothetical protein A2Z75_00290 [Chloroflexi bacterium RBG_13_50_10]
MRVNCHKVSKVFKTRSGDISALANISFHTEEQEFLCILGPSGCGKTTLLKTIARLIEPTTGKVTYEGTRSSGRPPTALVFQEHGVFPWMNVIDNVCFGLEMRGIAKTARYRMAMPLIDRLSLTGFTRNYPHQLSSGMKQRVGLARALVSGADILLMDEPFAALDAQMRLISQEQLLEVHQEYRKTVIYVTHDIDEAMLLADRIILLTARPGRIKEEIKVTFARPRNVSGKNAGEFLKMKIQIWRQIKEEVEGYMKPVS